MTAALNRKGAVFDFLVQQNCNLCLVDGKHDNVLHHACQAGIIYIIKELIDKHEFDIESRGQYENTPLMYAVDQGHMSVVLDLVSRGANVFKVNAYNNNILHVACMAGDVNMVKYVLSTHISDIECRGRYGRTPLNSVVGKGDMSLTLELIRRGADVHTVDDCNNNILHVACLGGDLDMVQYVLSTHISDIECRGQYGRTPLMLAVGKGHMSLVLELIRRGADVHRLDDNHNYILHMACLGGDIDMLKYILSTHITDVECRGQFGRTPLMFAVQKGHMSLVLELIRRGADVFTVDDDNNNILQWACLGGDVDMVNYILSTHITDIECRGQYGRTPLMSAVEKGHMQLALELIRRGANVHTEDYDSENILHVACLGGDVDLVNYVLSTHISDIECRGQYGRTPLMFAVEKGHMSLVLELIRRGADVHTIDDYSENILHVACIGGDVDMVNYILSTHISDIECRGKYGRTPLMFAVVKGHRRVVDLLLQYKSSLTSSDDNDYNVLHLACLGGQIEMVKYLVSLEELKGFEKRQNQYRRTPAEEAEAGGHHDICSFLQSRK